ncbi:hypothetical protein GCM10009662_21910 [Catellatospora coxensis]|uniref:Uncharacterized protein n=1 Tax=Catellatospora coxensis TaxID=310354 RepID=A0A8J3KJJ7_9ACTN|nr:hypothetical protein Cco03nite_08970 [Catellatospora coxensis]
MADGVATRGAVADVTGVAQADSARIPNAAAHSTAALPQPDFLTRAFTPAPAHGNPLPDSDLPAAAIYPANRSNLADSAMLVRTGCRAGPPSS